jgi:hypothetical protein
MISLVEIKVVSVCFEWMKINLAVEQQKSVIDKEMQERGWNEKGEFEDPGGGRRWVGLG